jgi:hypothetical protein
MDEDRVQCVDDDQASSTVPPQADSVCQLAGSVGKLEIVRPKRGSADLFRTYHVMVDGEDMGEVKRGHSRLLYITPGRHEVHVAIDWCRSPSIDIDVAAGETVELICWPKFPVRRWRRALANPDEYLVLAHSANVDG